MPCPKRGPASPMQRRMRRRRVRLWQRVRRRRGETSPIRPAGRSPRRNNWALPTTRPPGPTRVDATCSHAPGAQQWPFGHGGPAVAQYHPAGTGHRARDRGGAELAQSRGAGDAGAVHRRECNVPPERGDGRLCGAIRGAASGSAETIPTVPRELGLRLHTEAVKAGKRCSGSPNRSSDRG